MKKALILALIAVVAASAAFAETRMRHDYGLDFGATVSFDSNGKASLDTAFAKLSAKCREWDVHEGDLGTLVVSLGYSYSLAERSSVFTMSADATMESDLGFGADVFVEIPHGERLTAGISIEGSHKDESIGYDYWVSIGYEHSFEDSTESGVEVYCSFGRPLDYGGDSTFIDLGLDASARIARHADGIAVDWTELAGVVDVTALDDMLHIEEELSLVYSRTGGFECSGLYSKTSADMMFREATTRYVKLDASAEVSLDLNFDFHLNDVSSSVYGMYGDLSAMLSVSYRNRADASALENGFFADLDLAYTPGNREVLTDFSVFGNYEVHDVDGSTRSKLGLGIDASLRPIRSGFRIGFKNIDTLSFSFSPINQVDETMFELGLNTTSAAHDLSALFETE